LHLKRFINARHILAHVISSAHARMHAHAHARTCGAYGYLRVISCRVAHTHTRARARERERNNTWTVDWHDLTAENHYTRYVHTHTRARARARADKSCHYMDVRVADNYAFLISVINGIIEPLRFSTYTHARARAHTHTHTRLRRNPLPSVPSVPSRKGQPCRRHFFLLRNTLMTHAVPI